jgi:modification methylase
MKAFNDDLQMRSDWLLPICGGPERLRDGAGRKQHPTQKPASLLHRVILASSKPGDVILDPFFGTGTTGAVAKYLGRRFIGIERDAAYIEVARERIETVEPLAREDLLPLPSRRAQPKVPFGALVELGILAPGTRLYDEAGRIEARVRADGTLVSANDCGSIHKLGAKLQGRAACNGWAFWHVRRGAAFEPIDVLREEARKRLGLAAE